MKRILRHVGAKDFKKTHQRHLDEQKVLCEEKKIRQIREKREREEIDKLSAPFKSSWKTELFPEKVEIEEVVEEVKEERTKLAERWKYNWRESLIEKQIEKQKEELKEKIYEPITFIKNKKISDSVFDNFLYGSNWREELIDEGMSSKDFPYLYGYGVSIFNVPITSTIQNPVQSTFAQDIVNASADVTDYAFGPEFPGSYVRSIGGNQINSQSKVEVLAFLDTSYGDVSGSNSSYRLTTGPEGIPPEGETPPGSVVSRVNLESALGITLPSGVPNGNLGGTPIEGSAIKRIFTDAKPGRRINFNWTFASSEDSLGAATVDDYAFVAIKGNVTKFVSVLTRGLKYGGQFIYTVQPEDIVDGKVEIGIGVIDVYDPYVQTALNISNFGSFWTAGTLGDTTDAADLGMSVAAATPSSNKKKKEEEQRQSLQSLGQTPSNLTAPYEPQSLGQTASSTSPSAAYQAARQETERAKARYDALLAKASTSKTPVNLTQAKQDLENASAREFAIMTGKQFVPQPAEQERVRNQVASNKDSYMDIRIADQKPQSKLTSKQSANTDTQIAGLPPGPKGYEPPSGYDPRRFVPIQSPGSNWGNTPAYNLINPLKGLEPTGPGLSKQSNQDTQIAATYPQDPKWMREIDKMYNDTKNKPYNPGTPKPGNPPPAGYGGWNASLNRSLVAHHEPQGEVISEKKTPKILKSVQQALYPGQPSPNGFPDNPPPEMVNGYHPDFGNRENMYNTLDKASADSMPLTGNPNIDKKVLKARKQPK